MAIADQTYDCALIGATTDVSGSYVNITSLTGLLGYASVTFEARRLNDVPIFEGKTKEYAGSIKRGKKQARIGFSVEVKEKTMASGTTIAFDVWHPLIDIIAKGNIWLWCNNYHNTFEGNYGLAYSHASSKALKVVFKDVSPTWSAEGVYYQTYEFESAELA